MTTQASTYAPLPGRSAVQSARAGFLTFRQALWAMPCLYAVHICEEWFGGFPRYVVEDMHGSAMPGPLFFANNALFMLVLLSLCAWAARSQSRASIFVLTCWASANLFWNFVVHLLFTVTTHHYSPGLVTGTLFYYPVPPLIAALALRERLLGVMGTLTAYAIGAGMMAFVIWAGVYHFAM